MGLVTKIDHFIKKIIFSLFWWFMDPLEPDRLFSQLTDQMDRNLDANNPNRLLAPDNYDVLVNNNVFIKHAHAIKTLESSMQERLQRYAADRDYELPNPLINLQIISSATISKNKVEIRVGFNPEEEELQPVEVKKGYQLKVIEGQGKGQTWKIKPGETYNIGRVSSADICLPYENISKKQATLYFMDDSRIIIIDEGSANGTFINKEDEPVKGSMEIKIGDTIKFCKINPIVVTLTQE